MNAKLEERKRGGKTGACKGKNHHCRTRAWELSCFGDFRKVAMTLLVLRHFAFSRRALDAPGCTNKSASPSAISNRLINCASDKPKATIEFTRQNSTAKRAMPARIK